MDTNLMNMFASTYGDAQRSRQAFASEQKAKEAQTLESMFRTKRGEQLLPSEVSKANFEASPEMQEATLGKSQAEAKKLKAEADTALMKLSDDQITQVYRQGIAVHKNMLTTASTLISSGYSTKDALDRLVEMMPEEKRNDPKLKQMIGKYYSMPPEQAQKAINTALSEIARVEAEATDPNYIRQILVNKGQAEQERIRGGFALQGDKVRAAASKDSKPTAAQFTLAQIKNMFPNETDAQIAERFLQYQKEATTTEENPYVPGMTDKQTRTPGGLTPRSASPQQDPNLAKLPAGSKALGNGIYQLPNGKKVKAN